MPKLFLRAIESEPLGQQRRHLYFFKAPCVIQMYSEDRAQVMFIHCQHFE